MNDENEGFCGWYCRVLVLLMWELRQDERGHAVVVLQQLCLCCAAVANDRLVETMLLLPVSLQQLVQLHQPQQGLLTIAC